MDNKDYLPFVLMMKTMEYIESRDAYTYSFFTSLPMEISERQAIEHLNCFFLLHGLCDNYDFKEISVVFDAPSRQRLFNFLMKYKKNGTKEYPFLWEEYEIGYDASGYYDILYAGELRI